MLRQAGYTLVECWECEFNEEKKSNPQLKAFLDTLEMVPPLNPREAFYGGRTGAVALHCKVEEPDLIKYADVTSLYPWVNKYKEYPVRFPLIYAKPRDQDIHHYFGIAQVDILPPELLYHPVLPYRAGNKLSSPCAVPVWSKNSKSHGWNDPISALTPMQNAFSEGRGPPWNSKKPWRKGTR